MKRIFISLFLVLLSIPPVISGSEPNPEGTTEYERIFDEWMALPEKPPDSVATVKELTFRREGAEFRLTDGKIYLLPPVNSRRMMLYFRGNGVFGFVPPTGIEKQQLRRFFEKRRLDERFTTLFLLFADSTLQELRQNLDFTPYQGRKFRKEMENVLEYLGDKDAGYLDTHLMKTLLDNRHDGFFYAHFSREKSDPLFFRIDPREEEEVRLLRRAETAWMYKIPEVVCQFHRKKDYAAGQDFSRENKDELQVRHYKIDATIRGNLDLDFSAVTEMTFTVLQPGQHWMNFRLFNRLKADSIFWENGAAADFFKGEENPVLWVKCDSVMKTGTTRRLKLYYHGDLLERDQAAHIYIKSASAWYPRYGRRNPATFDLTYHTPEKFPVLASVGRKILWEEGEEFITSRWIVGEPVNFAAFNLGDYRTQEMKAPGVPPVTIMGYKQSRAIGEVGSDVVNSLKLFRKIFGEYPVGHFYATETPYLHGLAFPGLIHLSSSTFYSTDDNGLDRQFRAHEVAHQWWGIAVDYATYHDAWISEGFCDFAGLKYLQIALLNEGGTEKYFDILKKWRKMILGNRKYLLKDGQEAGPVWLGYRTSSSTTRGDYDLIIYRKGAWVFHMLRMMMIDVRNLGNERKFTGLLQDFYRTYRGKKVSTADFRKIVEKHCGMQMDWFFRQWVYGTDIPRYTFASKTESAGAGRYIIKVRVEQENVPGDFMMPVLFRIELEKNRSLVVREFVSGPASEFELARTAVKPRKIEFNYLESVLCEMDTEDWDD